MLITQDGRRPDALIRQALTGTAAQLALLALLGSTVGLGAVGWLAGTAAAVTVWAVLIRALRRSGALSLGPADRVTVARATLIGGVLALVADSGPHSAPLALVALSVPALVLDAVDGKVARRTETASAVGARFDMEIDALLILVLSVFVSTFYGVWVLAIGAMRYAFAALALTLPWMQAPLPPSFARKAVAAAQGIALVLAASTLLPNPFGAAVVGLSLALLVWSFGRDTIWLWQSSRSQLGLPRLRLGGTGE
ncbi:CDP-alcohol phosphatidyltransferase family protein [Streptomyces sp. 769]|uniref:CDP-alcohol phosphatidyltransferase family protein n=1 Tax=Streptomyces sp. 769 TaxID=1262452 RepID=UPI000581FC73|nr:CDP-alcohol phosphatidyltransferase family protein [Streptomyces sp. 769]AJC52693.1 integral membrane protein [Streptomyces sp. 769]AJC61846.1 integral membrane protein [Streptomyces sp. 769]